MCCSAKRDRLNQWVIAAAAVRCHLEGGEIEWQDLEDNLAIHGHRSCSHKPFGCFSSNNSSRCNKLENFSVTFRRAGTFWTPTMLSRNFERWKKICRQYLPMPMPCSPLALTMPPPSTCLCTNAKTRTTIAVCRGKICWKKCCIVWTWIIKILCLNWKKVTWGQLASLLFFWWRVWDKLAWGQLERSFWWTKNTFKGDWFGASLLVQVFYRVWGKLACPSVL